jgi:hypothetical protein
MNKQMMEAMKKTDTMFNMDEIKSEKKPEYPKWFYVTRNRDTEMLFYYSPDGTAVWCSHDLQHTVPHMYTSAQVARRDMAKHGGDNVRMSRYQVINGRSVWLKK